MNMEQIIIRMICVATLSNFHETSMLESIKIFREVTACGLDVSCRHYLRVIARERVIASARWAAQFCRVRRSVRRNFLIALQYTIDK